MTENSAKEERTVMALCHGLDREAEVAELLFRVPRRHMRLVHLLDQIKPAAEFGANGSRIKAHDLQSAALPRAVDRESRDDDMAPANHRALQCLHVLPAVG